MSNQDVPFTDLALLYLKHHQGGLSTPEDYVREFNRVKQIMEASLPKQETSCSAPPAMPMKKSYWGK